MVFEEACGTGPIPVTATNMLFEMIDTNRNGQIEFSEFKAAILRTTMFLQENQLRKAFKFFDKDNSGFISKLELKCVFETHEDLFNMFEAADYDAIID